jgi:hypothetical protein
MPFLIRPERCESWILSIAFRESRYEGNVLESASEYCGFLHNIAGEPSIRLEVFSPSVTVPPLTGGLIPNADILVSGIRKERVPFRINSEGLFSIP